MVLFVALLSVSCNRENIIPEGDDSNVVLPEKGPYIYLDAGYRREVTVSLVGMTYNGATSFKYTPNTRNVTLNGLKTTTDQDKVSFTIDASDYNIATAEGARQTYKFNGAYVGNVTRFDLEEGIDADFQFDIPADSYYDGMIVYVTLNRLVPAEDEENLEYDLTQRAVGDRYLYRVPGSGRQTIRLATAEATEGDCTVTLEADFFQTEEISVPQIDVSYQFGAEFNTKNPISVKSDLRVTFNIPDAAYVSGMKVKVKLERLVPNNDGNLVPAGDGVYEYTVPRAGNQELKVKANENEAGSCAVTLEARNYYFTTQRIQISQIEVSLEPQLTSIWINTENAAVDWGNSNYRFGLDGKDGSNECDETFSQEVWNVIKNGTFYLKFRPVNPNFSNFNMRIDTGWWDFQNIDVKSGSNFIKSNGDGTYYILINFSDPSFCDGDIKDLLDDHHLLFTGSGYTPIELYCYM